VNPDWTGVLIAKMSNGAGGYEPGTLILNKTAPVGRHGTTLLLARLLQCHYWELPTRRSPGGTDGAEWILEGVSDGRYQVVDRWSPGEADPIYALAMTLMVDLAGMRLDPKEVY
jgi:hypothetical protein